MQQSLYERGQNFSASRWIRMNDLPDAGLVRLSEARPDGS